MGERRGVDTSHQRLWLCRWGTQTAMVWAGDPGWAELRVRHGVFRRTATPTEVLALPRTVTVDVHVRQATDSDVTAYLEAGGSEDAVKGWERSA